MAIVFPTNNVESHRLIFAKAEKLQARDRVLVPDRLRDGPDWAGPGDLPGGEQDEVAVRGVGRLGTARAAEMRP